jgi:hypothetical protein
MALTFNGTSSGLFRAGSIVTAYPFTIFAWTKASRAQTGFVAEVAIDPGPRGTHEGHGALADGTRMRAYTTIGSSVSAYSSRAETLGDWVPCMVVFATAGLRKVYYGNGAVQTETTSVPQVPAQLNAFSVGKQAVKAANYFAGDLACVGLWASELNASDFAVLMAGAVPSTVQGASLIDYWSLLTQSATQIGINGRELAATSTAQAVNHPISSEGGSGSDTTPPVLTGTVTVSNLTSTSYSLAWPAGTDDVAVAGYEVSVDGGSNWSSVGNTLSANVSSRTPGSTDQVRVRARDAAGNASSPSLSVAVTLPGGADVTAPVMSGSIAVSALTTTSYALSWTAGTDNVGITSYEVSVDGGGSWTSVGLTLSANVASRTPGSTDQVRVRAKDAAGNPSNALSTSVTLQSSGPTGDTTLPTLTGSISVTALTSTSYTLSWPAGADNTGVTGYERSLDGGSTWASVGNALTVDISGRTPQTTDQVRVRAKDAAGNVSTPPLSASVTLLAANGNPGTITSPPLKNNTGTLLANLTNIAVNVYNQSTGALVVRKVGLSSNAAGVVVISDVAIVAGTAYAYEVVTPANGRRLPTGTAV